MKKLLLFSVLFFATLGSCKKEQTAPIHNPVVYQWHVFDEQITGIIGDCSQNLTLYKRAGQEIILAPMQGFDPIFADLRITTYYWQKNPTTQFDMSILFIDLPDPIPTPDSINVDVQNVCYRDVTLGTQVATDSIWKYVGWVKGN